MRRLRAPLRRRIIVECFMICLTSIVVGILTLIAVTNLYSFMRHKMSNFRYSKMSESQYKLELTFVKMEASQIALYY
nr:MAG TPA: hypothetical protein [Caudoviricetes sp.]